MLSSLAVDHLQPQASQRAIEAAGSRAAAGAGEAAASEQLHEVFFGRPTISMPALFQAVATQAAHIRCAQHHHCWVLLSCYTGYVAPDARTRSQPCAQQACAWSAWWALLLQAHNCVSLSCSVLLALYQCANIVLLADIVLLCRRSAAGAGEGTGGVQALLHQLLGLSGLLVAAANATNDMVEQLKGFAQNEVSKAQAAGPGWLAGEGPRAAWSELSEVR